MKIDGKELSLITLVAKQYYYEGRTQDEISRSLKISRTKVGRMLKESHALGLVSIRIKHMANLAEPD